MGVRTLSKRYRALMLAIIASLFLTIPLACSDSQKTKTGKEGPAVAVLPLQQQPAQKRLKATTYVVENTLVKVLQFNGTDLWIGTSNRGVVKFNTTTKDSTVLFDNTNALISNGVFSITKGPDGGMWIGTHGGGLSKYDGRWWTNYNTQHGLCDSFVYDVLFDKNDVMWIATWSGANRIKGDINKREAWTKFTRKNTNMGLSDNWVYALKMGEDGILWLGTEVGLTRYDGKQWVHWDNKDGLGADPELLKIENEAQTSILRGAHHSVQAESTGMQKRSIQNFNPNNIDAIVQDKQGILWIGTWGGGLSRFDGKGFTNYTTRDGLAGNYVFALAIAPDGSIWAGTQAGISHFDEKKFTNYTAEDGLLNSHISALAFDGNGRLWAGGEGGVTRIDEFIR